MIVALVSNLVVWLCGIMLISCPDLLGCAYRHGFIRSVPTSPSPVTWSLDDSDTISGLHLGFGQHLWNIRISSLTPPRLQVRPLEPYHAHRAEPDANSRSHPSPSFTLSLCFVSRPPSRFSTSEPLAELATLAYGRPYTFS